MEFASLTLAAALSLLPASSPTPAPVQVAERGQSAHADRIVDHDHGFELKRLGAGWKLLDEGGARSLNPAAVAGASLNGGELYALVLAEHLPGADLESTAANLEASLGFEAVRRAAWGPATYLGRPAWRFHLEASAGGQSVGYGDTLFFEQDFLFQLVVFEPERDTTGAAGRTSAGTGQGLEQLEAAFRLLGGPVHARRNLPPEANAVGLGWRILGGVYEDGAYGFRLEPEGDWRIAAGDASGAGARIALVDGERRIAIRAERIAGLDPTAWARAVYRDFDVELPRSSARGSQRLVTGGGEVVFDRYLTPGDAAEELLFGVAFREDLALRIEASGPVGQVEGGLGSARVGGDLGREVQLALRGLDVLGPTDRERLAQPWSGPLGNLDAQIGNGWSYRDRTWRDYELGLELQLPGGCWEVAPERFGESIDFSLVDPGRGLTLDLERRVILGVSAEDWHEDWRESLQREGWVPETPAEAVRLAGGEEAHITRFRGEAGGLPAALELLTAERGGLGVALRTHGYPGCLDWERESLRALLERVRFSPGGIEPVASAPGQARDERFGWSLDFPDARWDAEGGLPAGARARSYTTTWERGGTRVLVHVRQDGDEVDGGAGAMSHVAVADAIESLMASRARWMRGHAHEDVAGDLDGRPALLRRWSSKSGQARLWCARRGRLVFVFAVTEAGLFAGDGFEELRGCFRFL